MNHDARLRRVSNPAFKAQGNVGVVYVAVLGIEVERMDGNVSFTCT